VRGDKAEIDDVDGSRRIGVKASGQRSQEQQRRTEQDTKSHEPALTLSHHLRMTSAPRNGRQRAGQDVRMSHRDDPLTTIMRPRRHIISLLPAVLLALAGDTQVAARNALRVQPPDQRPQP